MKIDDLVCNKEFEPCDERFAPTDEELEAMFADYNERYGISRPLALMGAI